MTPLVAHLLLAGLLFCLGFAGAVARRNVILVLISIELMLNAANLSFVAFWRHGPHAGADGDAGLLFALFSIAVAAAEATVGLALVIALFRHRRTTDLSEATSLKG